MTNRNKTKEEIAKLWRDVCQEEKEKLLKQLSAVEILITELYHLRGEDFDFDPKDRCTLSREIIGKLYPIVDELHKKAWP